MYLIPADNGVLNSNITKLFPASKDDRTISLILLSMFVNSASLAAVTPNFVLKNTLPKAPCRWEKLVMITIIDEQMEIEMKIKKCVKS